MSTPIKWNTSPSGMVFALARPRWTEVRRGLAFVQVGLFFLLFLVVPSLLLTRLARREVLLVTITGYTPEEAVELGWVLVGVGGVLAYVLVLVGQWRCLAYAPQGEGGKDMLFACLLCSLTAPLCLPAAYLLEGKEGFLSFRAGDVLRLVALLLGLFNVVLFSGFLRVVVRSLRSRGRAVVCFFCFVGFLVGCSVGLHLIPRQFFHRHAWVALAVGWFLCLCWHLLLVRSARRQVVQALATRNRLSGHVRADGTKQKPRQGQVQLQVAELLQKREEHAKEEQPKR
jgi:hypothetical protein